MSDKPEAKVTEQAKASETCAFSELWMSKNTFDAPHQTDNTNLPRVGFAQPDNMTYDTQIFNKDHEKIAKQYTSFFGPSKAWVATRTDLYEDAKAGENGRQFAILTNGANPRALPSVAEMEPNPEKPGTLKELRELKPGSKEYSDVIDQSNKYFWSNVPRCNDKP